MTTRHLIGYSLIVLFVAGVALMFWWTSYNSERNVRRRERHARRQRYKQAAADAPEPPEPDDDQGT